MRRRFVTHHFGHLEFDEAVDLIVVEHTAGLEEFTILVERLQGFAEGTTDGWNFLQFLGGQIVKILVHGLSRMNLVLDAVKTSHQQGSKAQIRVGSRVREADFQTLGLRRVAKRNTAGSRTVASRIGKQNRSFITRNQALVGVG